MYKFFQMHLLSVLQGKKSKTGLKQHKGQGYSTPKLKFSHHLPFKDFWKNNQFVHIMQVYGTSKVDASKTTQSEHYGNVQQLCLNGLPSYSLCVAFKPLKDN